MPRRLNLARRPFVETRPANLTAGVLAVLALVLTVVSVRTVRRYLVESHRTRDAIAVLRAEIDALETARHAGEAALARFDIGELAASAEDANLIAGRGSFSWTRFLTRVERTLPADVRVATIALAGNESSKRPGDRGSGPDTMTVQLVLVSRDPGGLPKTIRALYGSPFFDRPRPISEESPERGPGDGRRLSVEVVYRDGGKP